MSEAGFSGSAEGKLSEAGISLSEAMQWQKLGDSLDPMTLDDIIRLRAYGVEAARRFLAPVEGRPVPPYLTAELLDREVTLDEYRNYEGD